MLVPVTWVGSSFIALYRTFTLPYGSDSCPRNTAIKILPLVCVVVHKDGKNSRPFVFTVHSQNFSSQPVQSLDVSADSLEELNLWVTKIREAAQTADARVGI